MPTYDYWCRTCNNVGEVTHSIHDTPSLPCTKCSKMMERGAGGGIAVHFHGPGFYVNDYPQGK